MARLVLPETRYRRSFLAAMAEFTEEGRAGDDTMVGQDLAEHGATWASPDGFAAYVEQLRAEAVAPRNPAFVPHTTWWWVEGEEYVGRIDLRHRLTEHLREVGGHVGYDVRRSARRRGHATAMLRALLPHAAELGLGEVLITCDTDNVGSRRVIEACGGVLEDVRGATCRFWVPTARTAGSG